MITHSNNKSQYPSLNGLRAYAAIGIVMMHVLANICTKPNNNLFITSIIPWFTDFTLLFIIISSFSMCCGYFEKINRGEISPNQFYIKRFRRIWPFFAMMVTISFVMKPNWDTFCQSFANLTLCFNLLPNPEIEVVGVGWFIGIIFTFYILFPFFTFLLHSKKRGWIMFILSLIFCYIAITYFSSPRLVIKEIDRTNIIYCMPFFIAGGLVYLYRDLIFEKISNHQKTALIFCIGITITKFIHPFNEYPIIPNLIIFTMWLIYAIGSKSIILNNPITKYVSNISMEIYLCHMMFYRITEQVHLEKFLSDKDLLYIISFITTLVGAICFSHIVKFHIFPLGKKIIENIYKS